MFISKSMQDAINGQIQKELYSSYLYLAMAAKFEADGLSGFAAWMRKQADEEREHAMKFFDYVIDRGGKVTLQAIDAPPAEWGSPMEVFTEVLKHEQKVTSLIHGLFAKAVEEKDYASQVMLHWFIDEQVEEEKNAAAIVDSLKRIEDKDTAVLMLDHRLGKRGKEAD